MIDRAIGRELSFIHDQDSDLLEQATEALEATISFEIPGFGINHDLTPNEEHAAVHTFHQTIILAAANRLWPAIKTTPDFEYFYLGQPERTYPLHTDENVHLLHDEEDGPKMVIDLRLHTNGPSNIGKGEMVKTAPALAAPLGDHLLYSNNGRASDAALSDGYEDRKPTYACDQIVNLEAAAYDSTLLDRYSYQFQQNPLCSVLFRSTTSMGPMTAHKFYSADPHSPREYISSDLTVYSQLLY